VAGSHGPGFIENQLYFVAAQQITLAIPDQCPKIKSMLHCTIELASAQSVFIQLLEIFLC
jgi:hypothetical protein